MRVSACIQGALVVAMSASSPAMALVIRGQDSRISTTSSADASPPVFRDLGCNKDAIDACVASTGRASADCFGLLCAGRALPADGTVTRRQIDCTEENLLQCAILDWNEAQACFQQLCL